LESERGDFKVPRGRWLRSDASRSGGRV